MLSKYMEAKISKGLETEHDEMILAENIGVSHSLVAYVSTAPQRKQKAETTMITPKFTPSTAGAHKGKKLHILPHKASWRKPKIAPAVSPKEERQPKTA